MKHPDYFSFQTVDLNQADAAQGKQGKEDAQGASGDQEGMALGEGGG